MIVPENKRAKTLDKTPCGTDIGTMKNEANIEKGFAAIAVLFMIAFASWIGYVVLVWGSK